MVIACLIQMDESQTSINEAWKLAQEVANCADALLVNKETPSWRTPFPLVLRSDLIPTIALLQPHQAT